MQRSPDISSFLCILTTFLLLQDVLYTSGVKLTKLPQHGRGTTLGSQTVKDKFPSIRGASFVLPTLPIQYTNAYHKRCSVLRVSTGNNTLAGKGGPHPIDGVPPPNFHPPNEVPPPPRAFHLPHGLPPRFRFPHITPDTFTLPADGSPTDPSTDYHSPYNTRTYHQYTPGYSPIKWSDGRAYHNPFHSRTSPFGWSPPRPLRERDFAYPSIPFGWRVYSALAFDKQNSDWDEAVRHPLLLKHLVWARLSTRLLKATAKMLSAYKMFDDTSHHTTGNYFIFTAPTLHHALQFMRSNPYAKCGLYKKLILYEHKDKTSEHILLGQEGDEEDSISTYLIYGEDDTKLRRGNLSKRTILEEKHLRFLCRSGVVKKRVHLRLPRVDTTTELMGSMDQHLPITDEQVEETVRRYGIREETVDEVNDKSTIEGEINLIQMNSYEEAVEWVNRDPFTRGRVYNSVFVSRLQEIDFYGKCSTMCTPSAGTTPFMSETEEYYESSRDEVEELINEEMNITEDASNELDKSYYSEYLSDWVWVSLPEGEYWSEEFAHSGEEQTGDDAEPTMYTAYAANREEGRDAKPGFWLYKPESKVLFNDTKNGALVFGTGLDGTYSWDQPVDEATRVKTMIEMEIQKEEIRRGQHLMWDKLYAPVTANPVYRSHLETEEEVRMKWGLPHWDVRPGTLRGDDYVPSGMEFLHKDELEIRSKEYQTLMESPDVVHDIHRDFVEKIDRGEATLEEDPFRNYREEAKLEPQKEWFDEETRPTMVLWDERTQ